MNNNDRTHFLRRSDTALEGERESRDWLKSTPTVFGINRPIKDLQRTTTAKPPPPKQKGPPDAARASVRKG
jgi:hypothetical protein